MPNAAAPLPEAFDGHAIDQVQTQGGVVSVRENDRWRWLVFPEPLSGHDGGHPLQSLMSIANPDYLALPYMQAMVAALCFSTVPDPVKVLQFGLGGGAINRFMRHHFADSPLTSVDSEPAILSIYQQYFSDGENTDNKYDRLVIQSADQYIEQTGESFDLVLCDIYSDIGLPECYGEPHFFGNIKARLSEQGVVVINSPFRSIEKLQGMFDVLRSIFSYMIIAELEGFQNIIIYAASRPMLLSSPQCDAVQTAIDLDIQNHFQRAKYLPTVGE